MTALLGLVVAALTAALVVVTMRGAAERRAARRRHVATVRTLMELVDASDVFTRGHSARVSRLAFRLGSRLGLRADALEELQYAALLHDIGRTAIRRDVLGKSGPLTEREREIVRTHPAIGHDLVEPFGFFPGAADIILAHHEQPDGKGYPHGLAAEQIPMAARILMVAAAFDALTVDRPYRRGLSAEEALAEIRRHAGSQFDAAVVDRLERLHVEGRLLEAPGAASTDTGAESIARAG